MAIGVQRIFGCSVSEEDGEIKNNNNTQRIEVQCEKIEPEHVNEQPQSIPTAVNWNNSLFSSNTCNTDG